MSELKSMKNSKFKGEDLRSRPLDNVDLTGSNLSNANLAGMTLNGTNLDKCDLREADLNGTTFINVSAKGIQAKGNWQNVTLRDSDFSGMTAKKSVFNSCVFDKVLLNKANLNRAVFDQCTITDCEMYAINAPDATFKNSKFEKSKLKESDLSCPNMDQCSFTECSFTSSDISGAVAKNVTLTNCDLEKVDLIASEFENLILKNNNMQKANFRYARGLSEEQKNQIKQAGGKVSKGLIRKALKAVFGNWTGRAIFAAILITVVATVLIYNRDPGNWPFQRLLDTANQYRQQGKTKESLQYLVILQKRYCSSDDPRCMSVLFDLASAHLELQQEEQALLLFKQLLTYEDTDDTYIARIQMTIANTLEKQGKYSEALEAIEKVFQQPGTTHLLEGFQDVLLRIAARSEYHTRIFALLDTVKKSSFDPSMIAQTEYVRASTLLAIGKRKQALKIFKSIVQMDDVASESIVRSILQMAQIYQEMGQTEKVREAHRQLRERFPEAIENITSNQFDEAQRFLEQGKSEEAKELYREIIESSPNTEIMNTARMSLASILIREENFSQAEELIKLIIDNANDDNHNRQMAEARILQAELEAYQGNHKKAAAILEKVIESNVDSDLISRAMFQISLSLRELGQYKRAIDILTKRIDRSEDGQQRFAEILNLAQLYNDMDKPKEAIKCLTKALATTESNNQIIEVLQQIVGIYKFKLNDNEKAVEQLLTFIDKYSDDLRIVIWVKIELVEIYRNNRQFAESNEILRQIAQTPFQADHIPQNITNITWGNEDPTSNITVITILKRVAQLVDARNSQGANARLALASQWLAPGSPDGEPREEIDEDDIEQAKKYAEEVIENCGDMNLVYNGMETLATIYLLKNDCKKAQQVFSRLTTLFPENRAKTLSYLGQANALARCKNIKGSLRLYQTALDECESETDCCRIASDRAQTLVFTEQVKNAIKAYQYIIENLPNCWAVGEAQQYIRQNTTENE